MRLKLSESRTSVETSAGAPVMNASGVPTHDFDKDGSTWHITGNELENLLTGGGYLYFSSGEPAPGDTVTTIQVKDNLEYVLGISVHVNPNA